MLRTMLTRCVLAASVAVSALAIDGAPPELPDPDSLRERVTQAVAALNAPRLEDRRSAEESLIQLGPTALEFLPSPDLLTSAASREALRRVRIHLELAAAAVSLQPTTVTLAGSFTAGQFAEEIEKQTHFKLQPASDLHELPLRQPVNLDRATAWQAIEELTQQVKGAWSFEGAPPVLTIGPKGGTHATAPVVHRSKTTPGSIHIRVVSIEQKAAAAGRIVRLQLGLAAEPRLRPLLIRYAMSDLVATTEAGEVIPAWNPAASYELAAGIAGHEWLLAVELWLPEGTHPATLQLTGRLNLLVATGNQEIIFPDWSRGRRTLVRRGGATATLRRALIARDEAGHDEANVEILLTYDTDAPPLESHQRWVLHQDAALRAPDGSLIPFARSEVSEEQTGGFGVTYTFANVPNLRDTELVYRPATAVLQTMVDFELLGTELPDRNSDASPRD